MLRRRERPRLPGNSGTTIFTDACKHARHLTHVGSTLNPF